MILGFTDSREVKFGYMLYRMSGRDFTQSRIQGSGVLNSLPGFRWVWGLGVGIVDMWSLGAY